MHMSVCIRVYETKCVYAQTQARGEIRARKFVNACSCLLISTAQLQPGNDEWLFVLDIPEVQAAIVTLCH